MANVDFGDMMATMVKKKYKDNNDVIIGFKDVDTWVDIGMYALNHIISGDFNVSIPFGKSIILAGESGAGKTLIASTIVKNAQQLDNVYIVLLDPENGVEQKWMDLYGIDTTQAGIQRFVTPTFDMAQKVISDTLNLVASMPLESRPKVLFMLDSLTGLCTKKEHTEFKESGKMTPDMGHRAKMIRLMFKQLTVPLAIANACLVATSHTYSGSDAYGNSYTKVSGGDGGIYAASIVLTFRKKKLKDETETEKLPVYNGIEMYVRCEKTRFTRPFREIRLDIPYDSGIDPYIGLFDALLQSHVIDQTKKGSAYYTHPAVDKAFYKKDFRQYADAIMEYVTENNQDIGDVQEIESTPEGAE